MARPSRLAVLRSSASSLLKHGADDEEIRAAIDQPLLAELAAAYRGVTREMVGSDPTELFAELTKFAGLVGQNWSMDGRAEWIDLAGQELIALPGAMALDALKRARRRVTDGRFLVSWIVDDVEPRLHKLQAEREQLEKLMALASTD